MKKSAAFKKLCKKFGVDPDSIPEIMTWEDACKATGNDPKVLPDVKHLPVGRRKPVIALYKLEIIAEALNEQKRPNYTDTNEYKYFPFFIVKADAKRPSGFGLSFGDCDFWLSRTDVGVRLCLRSYELAKYIGRQFISLYEEAYLF